MKVRRNYRYILTHTLAGDGVRLAPLAHGSGREAFQPGDDGAPIGFTEVVDVVRHDAVLVVAAHGVKVAWIVGDGVAVVVRHDVVRALLIVARGFPDRGEGVAVGVAFLLVA